MCDLCSFRSFRSCFPPSWNLAGPRGASRYSSQSHTIPTPHSTPAMATELFTHLAYEIAFIFLFSPSRSLRPPFHDHGRRFEVRFVSSVEAFVPSPFLGGGGALPTTFYIVSAFLYLPKVAALLPAAAVSAGPVRRGARVYATTSVARAPPPALRRDVSAERVVTMPEFDDDSLCRAQFWN
jgi:hypothetical protein